MKSGSDGLAGRTGSDEMAGMSAEVVATSFTLELGTSGSLGDALRRLLVELPT